MNQSGATWKKKVGLWGIGFTANFFFTRIFDFVIYPGTIWCFGLVRGAVIMWGLSFLVCYLTIRFYDWSKKDWIGIETLKEMRDASGNGFLRQMIGKALKKGDAFAILILSIQWDPFICTAYMRKGAHQYNGMNKRDWTIFLISFVIANLWWTTIAFTGINIAELILNQFA